MHKTVKPAIDGGAKVRTKPWPDIGRRFGKEELKELKEALDQNTLFYNYGTKTRKFCAMMAKLTGRKHAIACSSGSAALHGSIKAAGVGPGDEVITSPVTDAGTILGIVYEGAIPVFADIDPKSYNITAETISKRITPRTRAVIAVHLQGNPADIKPVVKLCRQRKLVLIEDCAQAWGAKVGGKWVGSFGDFGCFSMNDFKHISCGDGGVIVTDDEDAYHRAWLSIDKCYDRVKGTRALTFCAPNYRITELQSAVGIAQLGRLNPLVTKRNKLGERLTKGLAKIKGVFPPKQAPGSFATWWFYLIGIDTETLGVDASTFVAAVNAEGIPGGSGYAAVVHTQYQYLRNQTAFNHSRWPFSAAKSLPKYGPGLCPEAERAMPNTLNFPLNQWLTNREIDDCIAAVSKVARHFMEKNNRGRANR